MPIQARARNQELNPGPTYGWHGIQLPELSLLSPGSMLAGNPEAEPGLKSLKLFLEKIV